MGTPNIEHDCGDVFVISEVVKGARQFVVCCNAVTISWTDSTYLDRSVAVARCNYLAARMAARKPLHPRKEPA